MLYGGGWGYHVPVFVRVGWVKTPVLGRVSTRIYSPRQPNPLQIWRYKRQPGGFPYGFPGTSFFQNPPPVDNRWVY